jgi:hypothetical protein
MRRFVLLSLFAVGVILFLGVAALLARAFTVDGAEQSAITDVLKAQARGDAPAIIARIRGCEQSAACRARAQANAASLRHPGVVTIAELNPSAGFSLGSTLGTARVAWRIDNGLPIVQCVRVRRAGNILSGLHIELLELSRRIKTDSDCPPKY